MAKAPLVVVERLPPRSRSRRAGDETSSPRTSSADEATGDARREAPRKQRPTYEARRREILELQDEVKALREELAERKAAQAQPHASLATTVHANALMQSLITHNQLAIATAQSLVSSSSLKQGTPPIGSYVRLPADPAVRQQILDGLKPHKIKEGVAFMLARSHFTDLSRECFQLDKFVTSNGDHILIHWEVALIKAAVVKDVFQELIYFKSTLEMTLAEELGVLCVRESDSTADGTETQIRGFYTQENGVSVENNYIHFSEYFPRSEAFEQPHAIVIVDCVDQDDAFPFQSETRIRKDISSATMLLPSPSSDGVAILEYSFVRIHKSPLATTEELDAICRYSVRGYFDLLVKKLRERVAWRTRPGG